MTDFLVTHSYFLNFDPKQKKLSKPYPPLATLLLCSVIEKKGLQSVFFDSQFCSSAEEIENELIKHKPEFLLIADDGFNYLTKMCLSNMRDAALKMISIAKKYNCKVIISGSDSTDHHDKYFEQGADIIILGEAEETLKEITECIKENKPFSKIPGLVVNENNKIVNNGKRKVINDLDHLPLPSWNKLMIEPYKEAWKKHDYFSLNIATTRGCPFKCNWCAKPIYGNRYNSRSPENVISEIEILLKLFSPQHIWFCDDIFGLKPGWVNEFSELVKRHGIKIKYKIQSRADLLQDELTVKALSESGCDEIWIGAESGSQKILDAMDKGITVEEIQKATQLLRKYGIKPCFFIQFGYLGETKEDIEATLKMIDDLKPHDIGVSVSYPLPGTVFHEKVKDQLGKKSNWTDSDELALMFKSTFDPGFYKSLHRYIHKRFRANQGIRFFTGEKNFGRQAMLMPYFYLSALMYRRKMKSYKSNLA